MHRKDFRNLIEETEAREITFSKEVHEKDLEFSTLLAKSIELAIILFCFT